jgi:hypothetical protein
MPDRSLWQDITTMFDVEKLRGIALDITAANQRMEVVPITNPAKLKDDKIAELLKQRDLYKNLYVSESIKNKEMN